MLRPRELTFKIENYSAQAIFCVAFQVVIFTLERIGARSADNQLLQYNVASWCGVGVIGD
jgi:hypothetical protein